MPIDDQPITAQIKEGTAIPWRKSMPLVQLIDSQRDNNQAIDKQVDVVVALAKQ
ncbi:MAG: hypothetical protein HQ527_09615 [Cyanobacteria bacterium]|nr:hypothetical protein [Cyanobacteria bacterium bin.51]